jgi:hypothetical protein
LKFSFRKAAQLTCRCAVAQALAGAQIYWLTSDAIGHKKNYGVLFPNPVFYFFFLS